MTMLENIKGLKETLDSYTPSIDSVLSLVTAGISKTFSSKPPQPLLRVGVFEFRNAYEPKSVCTQIVVSDDGSTGHVYTYNKNKTALPQQLPTLDKFITDCKKVITDVLNLITDIDRADMQRADMQQLKVNLSEDDNNKIENMKKLRKDARMSLLAFISDLIELCQFKLLCLQRGGGKKTISMVGKDKVIYNVPVKQVKYFESLGFVKHQDGGDYVHYSNPNVYSNPVSYSYTTMHKPTKHYKRKGNDFEDIVEDVFLPMCIICCCCCCFIED
jgi:hypothetical protein